MAQRPRPLSPHSSTRHLFGAELRRWRTLRGLSQDKLGKLVFVSGDMIAKVEKAERTPTVRMASLCDKVLQTDGRLQGLLSEMEATRSRVGGRYRRSPRGEGGGGTAENLWSGGVIGPTDTSRLAGAAWFGMLPGCFVGPPGTSLVLGGFPTRIEAAHVEALRESIEVFEKWDHQYGGGLARAAIAGHFGWACQVTREASMIDKVRPAWLSTVARLGDLVGWVCFDAGEDDAGLRSFLTALQLAGEAQDVQQRAHTATSLSRQLTYLGMTREAVDVIDLARLSWRHLPALGRCVIGIVEARAYGRCGDVQGCSRAVGSCDEHFSAGTSRLVEDETWGYYADEGQVLGDAGHALYDLVITTGQSGHVGTTIERLEAAYVTHPPEASRSKALTMLRVACLKARHGDPQDACAAAEQGIADAAGVWSRRVADDLRALDAALSPLASVRRVRDQVEQLRCEVRRRTNNDAG